MPYAHTGPTGFPKSSQPRLAAGQVSAWLVTGLFWLLGALLVSAADSAHALVLDRALMVQSNEQSFPESAPARPVRLPDVWNQPSRNSGSAWYRLTFAAEPGGAPMSALLEQVCTDFSLSLNGHVLHTARRLPQSLDDMRSRACLVPAVVELPGSLLQAGENTLDIQVIGLPPQRVASSARVGALGLVHIDASAPLLAQAATERRLAIDVTVATTTAAALVGLAALALGRVSRLTYLGYFGAAALGWALWLTLRMGVELPLPAHWSEALLTAALPPVAVAGMLFLLRYCGLHMPWVDTSLWMQCGVVPLSLLVAMPDRLHIVAHAWPVILLAELAVAVVLFLRRAWLYSRADFWLMGAALLAAGVALTAEITLPTAWPELPGKQAIGVALTIVFGGMALRLLQRYHGEVVQARQAYTHLERKLHELSNAAPVLDEQAAREAEERAERRAEQAAAGERKRIAADLHDDLGAKLLTIVHTSDSERISTLAREALEEMRLSVRGLAGKPVQVGDAVGDWRSEAMSRLSAGGIELVWTVADDVLLSDRRMSARAYVQTTRILREAVSNLLKHSGATHTDISIQVDANDFELLIVDNGKGIPMELEGKLDRGHGMSTMKSRAKQLQGQCLVESGPGFGTTIRLTLPL